MYTVNKYIVDVVDESTVNKLKFNKLTVNKLNVKELTDNKNIVNTLTFNGVLNNQFTAYELTVNEFMVISKFINIQFPKDIYLISPFIFLTGLLNSFKYSEITVFASFSGLHMLTIICRL